MVGGWLEEGGTVSVQTKKEEEREREKIGRK